MADDAAGAVRRTPRPALLPRLAELAEQAGKLRTAEWLRTCALLPLEEWPPAPAYKGPMVPAADLDAARAELAQEKRDGTWVLNRIRRSLGTPDGRSVSVHARGVGAERDALLARLGAVRTVLDRPWPDDEDHHDFVNGQVEAARAALQGDQPTEEPLHWRTEDGGIAAVMCGSCHTLGGHDDDCPRRQPTGEADRG